MGSEGGNVKINPIHGLDLANKVGDIVKNLEEFKNKEVDVGGPDVRQLHDMASSVAYCCYRRLHGTRSWKWHFEYLIGQSHRHGR